jgi:hypothetical protein
MMIRCTPLRATLPLTLLSIASAATAPPALQAQRAEVQLLAGEMSDESGAVGRGLTLTPALTWVGAAGSLRLDGRATALEEGGRLFGAGAAFHVAMRRARRVELGASGSAGVLAARSGFRSLAAEVAPGIRLHAGAGSVAAGVGARGSSLSSSPPSWRGALPLGGGDEREERVVARSVWADARAGLGALGVGVHGRASSADVGSWREGQAAASLALGRVVLSGFAGARAGVGEGLWGGGSAALRVAPGVEVVAHVARHASDPLTGQPGGRTAAFGITLSRQAPAARAGRLSERPVRLALRVAPGARVELLADWNDWRPESVAHRGGGVYDVELRLPPGIYHFVFRVNGEVHVPEGYETAPDDFGGRSAVVRVRS